VDGIPGMSEQTITIPANAEWTDRVTGKNFAVLASKGPFDVMTNQSGWRSGGAGYRFGPEEFTRLTFRDKSGADNPVTFYAGEFPYSGAVQIQAAASGNYGTNSFVYDTQDGLMEEVSQVLSVTVPTDQPFRKLWLFYSHSTFGDGKHADLNFYNAGDLVLSLPAWHRQESANILGIAHNPNVNTNGTPAAMMLSWNNSDGGGYYRIHPFTLSVVCDTVKIEHNATVGVVRALLAVLSGRQPW
jgi:hypothetical protein